MRDKNIALLRRRRREVVLPPSAEVPGVEHFRRALDEDHRGAHHMASAQERRIMAGATLNTPPMKARYVPRHLGACDGGASETRWEMV